MGAASRLFRFLKDPEGVQIVQSKADSGPNYTTRFLRNFTAAAVLATAGIGVANAGMSDFWDAVTKPKFLSDPLAAEFNAKFDRYIAMGRTNHRPVMGVLEADAPDKDGPMAFKNGEDAACVILNVRTDYSKLERYSDEFVPLRDPLLRTGVLAHENMHCLSPNLMEAVYKYSKLDNPTPAQMLSASYGRLILEAVADTGAILKMSRSSGKEDGLSIATGLKAMRDVVPDFVMLYATQPAIERAVEAVKNDPSVLESDSAVFENSLKFAIAGANESLEKRLPKDLRGAALSPEFKATMRDFAEALSKDWVAFNTGPLVADLAAIGTSKGITQLHNVEKEKRPSLPLTDETKDKGAEIVSIALSSSDEALVSIKNSVKSELAAKAKSSTSNLMRVLGTPLPPPKHKSKLRL